MPLDRLALDLLAFGLLALCTLLGAWRGAWASGSALASLVGGYAAAVAAALWLGPAAAAALGTSTLIGGAAAGTLGFLVAALAIGAVGRAGRRASEARRGGAPRSAPDRAAGALFGLARGALLVLLLGVASLWLDAARLAGAPTPPEQPASDTPLRALTRATIEHAAGAAGARAHEPGSGALAVRIATRPAETLAALRRVSEHPALARVVDDAELWSEVEAGRIDFALARPSLRAFLADPAVRSDLAAAGAISSAAAADPARLRAELRPVLAEIAPRLARLRHDPELRELASDPEIADALARRDLFVLLGHPRLQRLVSRALAPAG